MKFERPVLFVVFLILFLTGFGCRQTGESDTVLKETVYTAFVINVHDWYYTDENIETLNKIIDLHEQYQMPVDIHLTDQVTQVYQEQAPELLERLKTSPYIAVSYHVRPPSPYYWDYDWLGLEQMDDKTLYSTVKNYEEHEIDLATGQPTSAPGGYELLKELIGYSPYVVSGAGSSTRIRQAADRVWKEKGAVFALKHKETTAWGEKLDGLWLRPEDLEIKVYEPRGRKSGESVLLDGLAELPESRPTFLNLKWHENNFYSWKTSWNNVYNDTSVAPQQPKTPPFDLSLTEMEIKDSKEQAEQWQRYEECLTYVKEHPEIFTAINARDLMRMMTE